MEQVLSSRRNEKANKNRTYALKFSKEKLFIAASVFSAFLIRCLFIPQNAVINGDGVYYATLGKKLVSGDVYGGISGYWSPFYSFLVGISSLFFQDSELAGRVVSVVAGAALVVPVYFLIRNFYGRRPAYLGTILLVIHPALLKSSGWVMTEAVYTLIFTTVVLVNWHALRGGGAKTFFIAGLLWGLAYLTKPEALGFLGLIFGLAVVAIFFRRRIGFRRYALGYFFLLLGFFVFFAPYVVFLKQKTGQWTISQKIMVNLPAMDYDKGFLDIMDDGQLTMQDRIWGDRYETNMQPTARDAEKPPSPTGGANLTTTVRILGSKALFLFKKQFRDYMPALLPYPFILIAIIGFFHQPLTKYRFLREFYLISFFICMILGYALSAVELRYLYPLVPILLAWVAKGIVEFSDWASKSLSSLLATNRKIKPYPVQIFVLSVFIVLLAPAIFSQNEAENLQNVAFEEKQAGLWIKNSHGSSPLVMSVNAVPAFYAGAQHLYLPNEDFPTVLEYAKRKQVNYLIFSERRKKATPEAFPPDEQNVPPELRLVYRDEREPGFKILVYQIIR